MGCKAEAAWREVGGLLKVLKVGLPSAFWARTTQNIPPFQCSRLLL